MCIRDSVYNAVAPVWREVVFGMSVPEVMALIDRSVGQVKRLTDAPPEPEWLLMTPLQWRFDIILTVPQRAKPGTVAHTWIGRLHLDAVTGAVIDPCLLYTSRCV